MPFDWLKSLKHNFTPALESTRRRRNVAPLATTPTLEPRTLLSAVPVGPETRVNSYTTNTQYDPAVAMDADGDYVVAWSSGSQDGSQFGIYVQLYRPGGTPVGAEFKVNTYTTDIQFKPVIAMDADGDFVVAWSSFGQDGSAEGIYAQRYSSQGTPLGEFKVNTYTTGRQNAPAVAMDANGDFVVTWVSYDQDGLGGGGIYAQRYNTIGTPQGTEFKVNTYTTDNQVAPSVAMDQDGDFVVTWFSNGQDGSSYGIYAQRYNAAGTPQGAEFRVNSYTTGDQRAPAVAVDRDGDFVITWFSNGQDGSLYGVYAQRYNAAGTPQGGEFRVNSFTNGLQNLPAIAMDQEGDFLISWQSDSQDGSGNGIYAQRYNAAGTPLGAEFRVNSYTTGIQNSPTLAMDQDGDFIAAWSSYDQDGSGSGIYAQRYRASHAAYLGSWRAGSFFLDSNQNDNYDGSIDDTLISFGATTDKPITGDWNGDGYDDIGVWRNGTFYLDANGNGLWDGSFFDRQFTYGLSSDTPLVGDWNRDGVDEVGVWRAGRFILDLNGNRVLDSSPTDPSFTFGSVTDTPLVGDWNGDGADDVGIWRAGAFYLDMNGNRRWDRPLVDRLFEFGNPTDLPVIGDWDGDGTDNIGVKRGSRFLVDYNGNGTWDGGALDYFIDFGNTTDTPLLGYWRPKSIPGAPPLAPAALPVVSHHSVASAFTNPAALASLIASPRKRTIP